MNETTSEATLYEDYQCEHCGADLRHEYYDALYQCGDCFGGTEAEVSGYNNGDYFTSTFDEHNVR